MDKRRLSDLIHEALRSAVEQERLDVAEHLSRALEESFTNFGGPGAVERRDVADEVLDTFERLDALRRKARAG
jgi:hypothetical protein